MVVYICTKFHENILDGIKLIERTRFSLEKISKGHNPVKRVECWFLFSAHRLTMVYICAKFRENILNDNRVMEQHEKLTNRQTDGGHDIIRSVFDGRIKWD